MYLPVNCAIIAQVYKDIQRMGQDIVPKTMTQLYTILILVLIKRHLISIGKWDENSSVPSNLKCLPEDIYTDLQRVCELAFNGLFKKNVQLVFTDVKSLHHLGLMNEVKEMYVCKGARTSYSFLHLSIQEFLAAWHVSIHPGLSSMVCSHIITSNYSIKLYAGGHRAVYDINPRFEMFARFIFGVIGPDASGINFLSGQKIINANLHRVYEAQNPEIMSMLMESYNEICIDSSLALYEFGYILVHVPISWRVTMSTSPEMLVSSLADNASSDQKISGSISELVLHDEFHSKLTSLPSCVTKHMTTLSVQSILNSSIPVFSQWLTTLSDLDDVRLGYSEPCEGDHLLYQSLQSLTKLRKLNIDLFCGLSSRGAQELSKVIANSSTLDGVTLEYAKRLCLSSVMFELDSVVQAVLSSSTVTSLETSFPFLISNKAKISYIKIYVQYIEYAHPLEVQRLHASLISLACYSRVMPLKFSISLTSILQLSAFKDIITILNNSSLHSTTSITHSYTRTNIRRFSSSHFSSLSHALKRDVSVPLSSLRKSQSLNDLSTPSCDCRDYYQSCPDLFEMQSLHNMHPKLRDGLGCDGLYYDKQCDRGREIKLKNHGKVHQRYNMSYFPGISITLYN